MGEEANEQIKNGGKISWELCLAANFGVIWGAVI